MSCNGAHDGAVWGLSNVTRRQLTLRLYRMYGINGLSGGLGGFGMFIPEEFWEIKRHFFLRFKVKVRTPTGAKNV